jgi:L-aspartate oxidase
MVTVIATGGLGQIYRVTTNPLIATGDGVAIAWRAGAKVSNMEFIQFHPTAFVEPGRSPAFLISEAVRGHGAYLRDTKGERFLFRYHKAGELACRDIVARAIETEIQSGQAVYLDCRHISKDFYIHFPTIYKTCLSKGVDLNSELIPVGPAAHYLCGGIDVDIHGRTSISNLYACGECSNTGLHGANRLASNSLLEALVYAHAVSLDVASSLADLELAAEEESSLYNTGKFCTVGHFDFSEATLVLQNLMSSCAGIVRSRKGLLYAQGELNKLSNEIESGPGLACYCPKRFEVLNMMTCAKLIVTQSLSRTENRGVYFNSDLSRQST